MVTRRRFLYLAGGGAMAVAAGAAGFALLPGGEKPTGDPKINYGGESCARCGMLISDDRFAAAWRTQAGKERHFDDVGCMVALSRDDAPGTGTAYYVRAYSDDAWLDAPSASYAVSSGIKSPMAYNIAAFAAADSVAAFLQDHQGNTATWSSLVSTLKDRG